MGLRLLAVGLCLAMAPVVAVAPAAQAAPTPTLAVGGGVGGGGGVSVAAIGAGGSLTIVAPKPSAAKVAKLTTAQKKAIPTSYAITSGKTAVKGRQPVGVHPADSTTGIAWCGSYWVQLVSRGGGGTLWRYKVTVPWCWNGLSVYDLGPPQIEAYVYLWASLGGWDYDGPLSTSQYKLDPTPAKERTFTQAKFGWCPPRIVCFGSLYPYLTMDVDRNGAGFLVTYGGTSW